MFIRLTKKKDFERVAKYGHSFFNKEFGFKIINNNLKQNRYGIVVNLKTDKRATIRNKIRRRFREIIRLNNEKLRQGFDIMILTRQSVKNLNYKEIGERLMGLLEKARLINF